MYPVSRYPDTDLPPSAEPDLATAGATGLTFREYAAHVPGVTWLQGIPWHLYEGALRPLCMPHLPLVVDRHELREALAEHRALLACWTSEWDRPEPGPWWWTCCDQDDYRVESIASARGRRSIRRGLRDCVVRRVPADHFGPLAYPIHRAALESYGVDPPTALEYARDIERMAAYRGTEFWAAFRQDRLAAFATCQVLDGAVTLGSTKSDPALDRYNPNAALFYSIARHYLQHGLRYISNGSRTLWHPTGINEFLTTLGFRRVYCRVNVLLSPRARVIHEARIATWGRFLGLHRLAGRSWARLQGFDRLMRIARSFA
jgi:hypothetical protein